jgi:hypothetical protein
MTSPPRRSREHVIVEAPARYDAVRAVACAGTLDAESKKR